MDETELLFTNLLSCNRTQLHLRRKDSLGKDKSVFVSSVLKRRIKGEPIQYILGKTDFFGLDFYVNPDVLIPRPETELLVETAVELLTPKSELRTINILDIGTGSGCIAVSLAKSIKNAKVYATDISKNALAVAAKNAKKHRVDHKIKFIHSDLFNTRQLRANNYELIISNPPYIPTGQIDKLQREVLFEPRLSLDGGSDGLKFIKKIIKQSQEFLSADGLLIMEIGFDQANIVKNLFSKCSAFNIIDVVKDYNQIDRVVIAKKR